MNLCVVDNRTNGQVSFGKAFLRTLLKGFLGIISFFSMNFSRRYQAIHDIVTGTSVCIKDPAKAKPHQYRFGRVNGVARGPSRPIDHSAF
jgi:uncharacterized RDD family membrane protein YckC